MKDPRELIAKKISEKDLNEKRLANPSHKEVFEQLAIKHQFGKKIPKHMADKEAYVDYRIKQHEDAAVHHFNKSRVAKSAGRPDLADAHAKLYQDHLNKLNHRHSSMPPQQIVQRINNEIDFKKCSSVEPHAADTFLKDIP